MGFSHHPKWCVRGRAYKKHIPQQHYLWNIMCNVRLGIFARKTTEEDREMGMRNSAGPHSNPISPTLKFVGPLRRTCVGLYIKARGLNPLGSINIFVRNLPLVVAVAAQGSCAGLECMNVRSSLTRKKVPNGICAVGWSVFFLVVQQQIHHRCRWRSIHPSIVVVC